MGNSFIAAMLIVKNLSKSDLLIEISTENLFILKGEWKFVLSNAKITETTKMLLFENLPQLRGTGTFVFVLIMLYNILYGSRAQN